MDVKEQTRKAYELFGKGDMETFFNEMIDDNIVWTFPGKEGVHPLSGVHKGKQAMMGAMSKIPATWPNFHLKILDMISEGNKVFVRGCWDYKISITSGRSYSSSRSNRAKSPAFSRYCR